MKVGIIGAGTMGQGIANETLGEYEFTGTGKTSCNSKNMRILTIIKKTIGVSVR